MKKLVFGLCLILTACSEKELQFSGGTTTISGSIAGFGALAAGSASLNTSNVSAFSCAAPQVSLYKIDPSGNKVLPAVATETLTADGRYSFNLKNTGLRIENKIPLDSLVVVVENCSEVLSRPVTGSKDQTISQGSSLIGYVLNSAQKDKLSESLLSKKDQLSALITKVENAGSLQLAYSALLADAQASSSFLSLFEVNPISLLQASPQVLTLNWPSQLNPAELTSLSMSVSTAHWSPTYTAAYIWKFDNTVISTTNNINYLLNANTQGLHTLTLYVGQDNAGTLDLSKPYQVFSKSINVQNTILPQPPTFTVTAPVISGTIPINTRILTLTLNTGAAQSNCASFTALALTEESLLPPLPSDFNILCSQNFTQNLNFSLVSAGDGLKTLRLWAMDASGIISVLPNVFTLGLDTTAPSLSILAQPASLTNSTSANFSFLATDLGSGINHYECRIDGGSFSACSSIKSYTGLSAGAHIFYLKAFDGIGNESATATYTYTIDLTPPAVAVSNPAANGSIVLNSQLSSFSVGGTCSENGLNVLLSGPVSQSVVCSSGVWSANLNLTAVADGILSLVASQTDAAGNVFASASRTFIKDTTVPLMAVGAVASTRGNGSYGNVNWTLTENNVGTGTFFSLEIYNGSVWVSLSTLAATAGANSNQAYSLTNFSVPNLNINNAQIRITLIDAAGNSTTVNSAVFTIDSIAPVISGFTLAGGSTTTAFPGITYAIASNDNLTGVSQIQVSESSTMSGSFQAYANNGAFTLTQSSGAKTVYVWVKDSVGNISVVSTANITLDFGSPPVVSVTAPVAGASFTTAQNVPIQFSCSSTNGLDANPVRIKYTINDGLSFTAISSWITNNLTATTGDFNWPLPSGITAFRLLVECKSAAGVVTSAFSAPLNTGGWSIFAGDPSNMTENVNASVALMSRSGSAYQTMAADIDGHVYYERGRAIMKIDAQTGLVTRFIGDPDYTGGTCNLQSGQDPLTTSFNLMSSYPALIGPSPDRTEIYFSACSKTWKMNTATRIFTQIHTAGYGNVGRFLARSGKYYYFDGSVGNLYRVDLTQINATPERIFGNSINCTASVASVGTLADQTAALGYSNGACAGETYFFTNSDESKIWFGNWSGVGTGTNTIRLDFDGAQNRYIIGSTNIGYGFGWDHVNCVPSFKYNRVHCSSRHSTGTYNSFNTTTEAWTLLAIGRNPFIRYAAVGNGMISLDSFNYLVSHTENPDGTITRAQVGGSDIETYGNGTDLTKVAFSSIRGITYSQTLNQLFMYTETKLRKYDFTTTAFSTTNYNFADDTGQITINRSGTKINSSSTCGGRLYQQRLFNGTTFSSGISLMSRNTCGFSVFDATYPVVNNTPISTRVDWQIDLNRRPLEHTNNKFYFFSKNAGGNALIYSSSSTTLNLVAGTTGASGYNTAHSGQSALAATLSDVRAIHEIPATRANAGDLLVVDNNRLRLITIVTESANPKIYDLVNFALAPSFSDSSDLFTDTAYDFNSEILDGSSNPILGTGSFYYVSNTNFVHKFKVTSVSGSVATAASDAVYTFNGTSLGGTPRLAVTPAGLLVTQPTKNRILRVGL